MSIDRTSGAGCRGYYGFPTGTHNCARCSDNEKCKHVTHLVHSNQISKLTRTSVTISNGAQKAGRDFTTIITLPIQNIEIFLRLLRHTGTAKQDLVFLIDQCGTAVNFKTNQEWVTEVDAT